MPTSDITGRGGAGHPQFATTRWSMVFSAGRHDAVDCSEALAALCEIYWYPLYAHVRRRGCAAAEAQDLVQEFFATLLDKSYLKAADPQRGRFRSFLLASFNHFVANEHRKAIARKRGGGRAHVPLVMDFESGESRYVNEPSHDLTPERVYERRWAMTLLERALSRLRGEYDAAGKAELYEQLKPFFAAGSDAAPYAELAERTGMSEGALRVAVHRLRKRCRELLREEIAQTVAEPDDVEDELRHLFTALGE